MQSHKEKDNSLDAKLFPISKEAMYHALRNKSRLNNNTMLSFCQ